MRIPFLPPNLDDIDSINFDMGVHDYNPAADCPHPPGYPVFILLAKLTHHFFASHAGALALLSVVFSSLSVVPLYFLMRELTSRTGAALACALTLMSPIVWFNSVRPMSDLTGLFAALAGQSLLLTGARGLQRDASASRWRWDAGVVAAGLAMGVRLQACLLVGPILMYGWLRNRRVRLSTVMWLTGSVMVWLVPLVYFSGGLTSYMRSFALLIRVALPAEPLLSAPTIHRAAFAMWDVLVAPWGTPWLGLPIIALAALGAVALTVSHRAALGWALLLFLPYTLYHYLLQLSETIRYAVPVVPLLALLASVSLVALVKGSRLAAAIVGLAFVALSSMWTGPALATYHRTSSPATLALTRLRSYAAAPADFVVAGHDVFERFLSSLQRDFTVLPPLPPKPWTALFEYWKRGERKPILFLRDPMMTSLLLVGPDTQTTLGQWSWPSSMTPFMKGERPSRVELVRLDPPRWFCETGFLVTPEAGRPDEVARSEHRVYVRPSPRHRVMILSGSLLDAPLSDLSLRVGGRVDRQWVLGQDFSVRGVLNPLTMSNYVPLVFSAPAPLLFTDFWIEREDRPVIRPAQGFYSPERDSQARLFRWMAPKALGVAYLPAQKARLRIRGKIPVKYYQLPVRLSLKWNARTLSSVAISSASFVFESIVSRAATDGPWSTLALTSSHRFIPDTRQKNGDRRDLSVQIYELSLTASP